MVIDEDRLAAQLQRVVVLRLIGLLSFLLAFFLLRVFLTQQQIDFVDGDPATAPSADTVVYLLMIAGSMAVRACRSGRSRTWSTR